MNELENHAFYIISFKNNESKNGSEYLDDVFTNRHAKSIGLLPLPIVATCVNMFPIDIKGHEWFELFDAITGEAVRDYRKCISSIRKMSEEEFLAYTEIINNISAEEKLRYYQKLQEAKSRAISAQKILK